MLGTVLSPLHVLLSSNYDFNSVRRCYYLYIRDDESEGSEEMAKGTDRESEGETWMSRDLEDHCF